MFHHPKFTDSLDKYTAPKIYIIKCYQAQCYNIPLNMQFLLVQSRSFFINTHIRSSQHESWWKRNELSASAVRSTIVCTARALLVWECSGPSSCPAHGRHCCCRATIVATILPPNAVHTQFNSLYACRVAVVYYLYVKWAKCFEPFRFVECCRLNSTCIANITQIY